MYKFEDALIKLRGLNCEEVAKAYGLKVKGHMAHCFMHNDKHPSLGFKNNHWKCFVCDKGGDAISLVMDLCQVSFKEACIDLCTKFNIPFTENGNTKYCKPLRKISYPKHQEFKEEKDKFDAEVAYQIINNLDLGCMAKQFLLEERKLSEKAVTSLSIKSLESNIIAEKLNSSLLTKFGQDRLKSCKIINDNGQLNINIPSLVIPYFDEKGKLITLQTRYLKKSESIPRFKLLCLSKKHLYNLGGLNEMRQGEKLYITEGITDCLAVLSTGNHAIAIQSASSIPEKELYLLLSYSLYMIPDQDDAGLNAFSKLFRFFLRQGKNLIQVKLPDGFNDFSDYYMSLYKD